MARREVTQERLDTFLRELGKRFKGHGRFYLAGGAHMVTLGLRSQTEDIDYMAKIGPDDEGEFIATLRELIRELDVSVEPAGPADFIPLPDGWENRSNYIGRYGNLEVFTFDPVATGLSKIERGTRRDIDDALALLASGQLSLSDLHHAFREIEPRLEMESLRVDPEDFRRKFLAFVRLSEASSNG